MSNTTLESPRMPHHKRSTIVLAAGTFMLTLALAAGPARAGTYDVYACDPGHAGGGTPSWIGWHDPGLTVYSNCAGAQPEGIVTRSVAGSGATSTGFQGAYAVFDAPDGTTIESIHAYFDLSRPGCNWAAGIKATNGDLGGRWVYALQPGYCGTNEISGVYWNWPINDKRVVELVACGASTCDRSSEARAAMRSVRITVNDPTPPSLTSPRGGLWASGVWLAGTRDIAFDASDGSGIASASVQVDGNVMLAANHACDYVQRAPCPNQGLSSSLDTSKLSDGNHSLVLSAIDAGGNPAQITETIQVDNTAPAAPVSLSVDGGDAWKATNGFALAWSNPPADGGAPVASAEYRLCPASGTDCITGTRSGDQIAALNGVQVPQPGDWTLQLWLRDAAGNADPTKSGEVHLRFDDVAPSVAFDAPNASDPTLLSATASDGESGIADGHIQIRRHGSSTWQTLPSTLDGTHITARLDDEQLSKGRYDLQAWATDRAGNERTGSDSSQGGQAEVKLPLRVPTRIRAGIARKSKAHHRANWRSTVRLAQGRRVRLGGRLLTADGNAIANSEVLVFSQLRNPNAPLLPVASLRTSKRGYFAYRVPKGPSRNIRFRFSGTATIRPAIRDVRVLVAAHSTIHANDTHLINGEYVHLRGRLTGGPIPTAGKLVALQVLLRGNWHTFANTRSGADGRWIYEYRFDGTTGSRKYLFRVHVPRELGYPFEPGDSRPLRIHVRGL